MSKVIIFMNLALDGSMQAPGRPDEDRRGGWAHELRNEVGRGSGGVKK